MIQNVLNSLTIGDIIEVIIAVGSLGTALLVCKKMINSFTKKINTYFDDKIKTVIQTSEEQIQKNNDIIKHELNGINTRLAQVEQTLDTNERDRLRTELFSYGRACRNGTEISGEEYEHLRSETYPKYKALNGNHTGDMEWEYITKYYTEQERRKY